MKEWILYIVECADNTLYTGITNDLNKRVKAHNDGTGAKYTRGRGPVVLRYAERCKDHSDALRKELQLKKLTREEKRKLCETANIKEFL